MRILFFHAAPYLPEATGGAEYSNHAICEHLIRRGIECAVLCGFAQGKPLSLMHRALSRLSRRLTFLPDNVMTYPVYRCWSPERSIGDVIKAFRPDVVVMQKTFHGAAAKAVRASGIPCVYFVRDVEFPGLDRQTIEGLNVHLLANSDFTARRIAETFGCHADTVLPLVDPSEYIVPGAGRQVVFVNPVAQKGLDIALHLAEARPDIEFLFVESWHLSAEYRQQLRERMRCLANVSLTRPVDDMRQVYASARVLLAPSRWEEAWGRVVTEAHFSGIPVLASSRGALPESVGPGGIVVPHDAGYDVWLAALGELWDDPERYRKISAAAKLYSQRDGIKPQVIVAKLAAALERIVGQSEAERLRHGGAMPHGEHDGFPSRCGDIAVPGCGVGDRRFSDRPVAQDVAAPLRDLGPTDQAAIRPGDGDAAA